MTEKLTGYTPRQGAIMDRLIGAYEWRSPARAWPNGRLHAVVEFTQDGHGHTVVKSTLCRIGGFEPFEVTPEFEEPAQRCTACLVALEREMVRR